MRFHCAILALGLIVTGATVHAACPPGNTDPNCPNNTNRARQQAQQEAQRRAQQEAQQRAQQQAQEHARQEAQRRAQQEAQQRAQQEARQRAQQEAQQRAQREAQQRAQQEAQQRAQRQAQERAKQQAQEQSRKQAQPHPQQQIPEHAKQPALKSAPGAAPLHAQQPAPASSPRQFQQGPARAVVPQQAQQHTSAPLMLNATTSLVPQAGRAGFNINHRNPDGSQLVATQRTAPDGTNQLVGYKQIQDAKNGSITRVYSDGYRVMRGREFDSRAAHGGPTYIEYRTGLRAAVLPNGRPLFREGFAVRRGLDGRESRVVERVEYARLVNGGPVFISRPIVRVYDVVPVFGAPVYLYRPTYFEPVFYSPFFSPFAAPLLMTQACVICPARLVAFATPVASYTDPIALMGDLQISTGFEDGAARLPASSRLPDRDDRALEQMRAQISDLQQQVSANAQATEMLQARYPDQGNRTASMEERKSAEPAAGTAPVPVSEDVRQQIRKEVRLNIAQHQNGHPLLLSDVIASGYAKIYLFQAAELLDVSDVRTGDVCFLNSGDLIGFASIPNGNGPMAEMTVITSGANSCRPKQVVQVRLNDLQGMLNGFSERVEENMKRVACANAPGGCSRT